MKRTTAALAALSAAALGTFAVALPATAEDSPGVIYPAVDWEILDWPVGTDPVQATLSGVSDDCTTLILDKPNVPSNIDPEFPPGSNGDIGTDFSTSNLDLDVNAGDFILVDYQLYDFDTATAGAVRMFAYSVPEASTEGGGTGDSPWLVAIVPGDILTGTLKIEFPADAPVGTFGLTYDASNDTEDYVIFSNLRYDNHLGITPISFCDAPEPPATETVTESPSPSPSAETTTEPPTSTTTGSSTETTTQSTESTQPTESTEPCVDVNTASVADLKKIIHIGDMRAQDLISKRPFTSVDDLDRIIGIGEKNLADIKAENLVCPFTTTTVTNPGALPVTGSNIFPKIFGIGTGLIVLGAATLIIVARRFRDEEQLEA